MSASWNPRWSVLGVCALSSALLLGGGVPNATAQWNGQSAFGLSHRPVCGAVPKRFARCHSDVVTDAGGKPLATSGPSGYGPADLQSAYDIFDQASSAGGTQT